MLSFQEEGDVIKGVGGTLRVAADDHVTRRLAMLIEGQCEGIGPTLAARRFGLTKQRYYQILGAYEKGGALALQKRKRGPKSNYRRTDGALRQVIRHRFLDPDASSEVIAQKLRQCGLEISDRSVRRVIQEYGLQKKTSRLSAEQ